MSNVIDGPPRWRENEDAETHEEEKFHAWRAMQIINDQTDGGDLTLSNSDGYVFGVVRDRKFYIDIDLTPEAGLPNDE